MRRTPMLRMIAVLIFCLVGVLRPAAILADCPGDRLVNPGFEGDRYQTEGLGTSLSSSMAAGWLPWSILGDATYNREVEYKVLDRYELPDGVYRIRSGNRSQKFFTTWGSHTAGMYQRVSVTPGTQVTFSIWVQIYTGEREIMSGGRFISDLQSRGYYRASVGIDPYGDVPASFGAHPSDNTIWSAAVTELDTRVVNDQGHEIDNWALLSVSTVAQGNYVTVYTRGKPEYPVKHNDSYWDDACLTVSVASAATPVPATEPEPTGTPVTADAPIPTTERPAATATATAVPPTATPTEWPTATPTAIPPTATPVPTQTVAPSATPEALPNTQDSPATTPQPIAVDANRPSNRGEAMVLIGAGVAILAVVGIVYRRRMR